METATMCCLTLISETEMVTWTFPPLASSIAI
jgi:hypothetical protein